MGIGVFIGAPAYGHTKPAMHLLKVLVDKGEKIYAMNSGKFKKMIEDTGAIFVKYDDDIVNPNNFHNESIHVRKKYNTTSDLMTNYQVCCNDYVRYSDKLIENVKNMNPDYIIFDSYQFFGKRIARALGIPAISSSTTFVVPKYKYENDDLKKFVNNVLCSQVETIKECEQIRKCILKIVEIYKKKYEMYDFYYIDRYGMNGDLSIVYTSKYFQPYSERLDESYIFTGCKLHEYKNNKDKNNRKRIYISLGSILTNLKDSDEFFLNCLKAFEKENVSLVIAAGNKYDLLKSYQNDYVRIEKFTDQEKEIQQADLVISHGGFNTIQESVFYGVPIMIYPYISDQFFNANLVHKYKFGTRIDDISVKSIKEHAMQILNDSSFVKQSKKFGATLRIQNGYEIAAEKIIDMVKDKKM